MPRCLHDRVLFFPLSLISIFMGRYFDTSKYPAPCPTFTPCFPVMLLPKLFIVMLVKMKNSNIIISSTFVGWHSTVRKKFSLIYLFVCLWTKAFLFYSMGYNTLLLLFILMIQFFSPYFGQWEHLQTYF